MWRWIFVVLGGVVALRVAANLWVEAYLERPISTVLGSVLVAAVLLLLAVVLATEGRDGQGIELRRASAEYSSPRAAADPPETVEHVVHHVVHHHVVEHVHRYVGDARPQPSGPVRALPPGPVVEGVVVRRAIGSGST